MAYIKQTWQNNPPSTATPITAERLDHLETQYDEALAQVAADIADPDSDIGTELTATFVARETIDLATFLLPGETMPDDGITDAYPLFQRAVDAAAATTPTTGPVTIRIPSGKFRIESSVRWFTGYHVGFVGEGRANTRILPTGNAVFGLMDPGFDLNTTLDDIVFGDMTIDCTNQVSTPNNVGAKGIALRNIKNGLFYRVRCINTWATSFGCDFLQDVRFVDCTAIRSGRGVTGGHDSFGAGFGIGVGSFENESVSFVNCYAEDSHSGGFFIERILDIPTPPADSRGFSMTGCTSIGGYNGFRDAGADGVIINGCHFLDAENAGIHIEGYPSSGRHGGRNGLAVGNVIRGNGTGVLVGAAATGGYTFDDNEITASTGPGVKMTAATGAGWRFLSNRIEQNGEGGLILDCPMLGRPDIRGNIIRENGYGDGIRISGDTYDPRIIDNIVQGHIGAGVNLAGAERFATDPIIRGNTLTQNSVGGVVNEKVTNSSAGVTGNIEGSPFATITNLFTTPSYTNGVNLAGVISRFDAPVQGTDGGRFGDTYARFTVNTAGSASARLGRVSGSLAGTHTMSFYVRAPQGIAVRPFGIIRWAANASQRTVQSGGFRATGGWDRFDLTVTLPADGSRIDICVALDGATIGQILDADGVMLTPGSAVWRYIDGDRPGCEWDGTPGDSTSTWTVGEVTLLDDLEDLTGETPLASLEGEGVVDSLSIPLAQSLTLYSVYTSAVAGERAALRTGTSLDRHATGRNGGNSAWVAVATDSSGTAVNTQFTAPQTSAVVAAVRDASSLICDVRGLAESTVTVATYDPATATRLVNDASAAFSVVYSGAHDETTRGAVMDLLADHFAVA